MELLLGWCGAWEGGKRHSTDECLHVRAGLACCCGKGHIFCFHLRACFIPPPSARERNLIPGQSHFLFKVGSADPEGRAL